MVDQNQQSISARRRKLATLVAVSIATFMVPLDITVVAVAMPDIQRSLGASFADLQWVVNAYTITYGSFLLCGGALADLFGRRRVFMVGLCVFTLTSLICGFASTPFVLNLARAAQGLGAAFLFSSALALLAEEFKGAERASAFGIWAAVMGTGVALGPMVGGAVTSWLGWHWAFLINVPIGIVVAILALWRVKESRDQTARGVDQLGVITFAGGFFLLIYALVSGGERGWSSRLIVGLLIGAALLFAAFVVVEARQVHPMFDLTLFRNPTFSAASLIAIIIAGTFFSLFIYLPPYFQNVLGYSPLSAGLAMLPLSVPLFVVPPLSSRLSALVPSRVLIGIGMGLVSGGLFWIGQIDAHSSIRTLFGGFVLTGIGAGIVNGTLLNVAIGVVPAEHSGMASGITSTCRQIGFALGIAGLGAILTAQTESSLRESLGGSMINERGAELAHLVAVGEVVRAVSSLPPEAQGMFAQAANVSFTRGLSLILYVCAFIAIIGAGLAFAFVREGADTVVTSALTGKTLEPLCPPRC